MDRRHILATLATVWLLAACDGDSTAPGVDGPDADGDFILDVQEGFEDAVDTDGDGLPDYLDLDSDSDGIPDAIEAGDLDAASSPLDSEDDGIPDFRDPDSDDNGIPDWQEGVEDFFGDGVPDFRDLDDDDDLLTDAQELAGVLDPPIDADGDGAPNYRDPDSDGDTILDGHDGLSDTDRDGLRDFEDLDSDNDGLPDREEAGDLDLRTLPRDTDGDGNPDFKDFDSDGDGLPDAREVELGADPASDDSDGDGVPDLIEIVACFDPSTGCETFVTDPDRSPRTEGNFVFVMPYEDDPTPPRDTLRFATDIRQADVYLLMDTTGSMGGAISSLKETITREPDGLIVSLRENIPEAWFGVGDFKDYSQSPYGGGSDYAYRHRLDMTEDAGAAQGAVNDLSASGGADGPESHVPAIFASVTGQGLPGRADEGGVPIPARTDCPRGTRGYPCFRERAVPIVVLMSDAPFHNGPNGSAAYDNDSLGGPAPTFEQTVAAVNGRRVDVIGIVVGGFGSAEDDQRALASAVGSTSLDGEPFVTQWNPSGGESISDVVVEQVRTLSEQTRFDVTLEYEDGPEDGVDTREAFVDHLAAVPGGTQEGCPFRVPVDTDADGYLDTFFNVGAKSGVCFEVVVKRNTTVEATEEPQLFRATLRVIGDDFTDLDVRDIYFLVPPDGDLLLPR